VRSDFLKDISRVVVKLGTGVLTDSRKQPDLTQMEQLVAQIAEQRKAGKEIVLVSSGAVGAGMGVLGHEETADRPRRTPGVRGRWPIPPHGHLRKTFWCLWVVRCSDFADPR